MRKIIKEKDGTGRGGQRGGMWRLRPPEGRKHPEEPGSSSRRGGETAGKSEGRLSRSPLPPARLPVTAPGQAAPHSPRPAPRRDPQARLPPPPLRPRPPGSASYFRSTHPTRNGATGPRSAGGRADPRSGSGGVRPTTGARPGLTPALAPRPSLPAALLLPAAAPTFSSSDSCSSRSAIFLLATNCGAGGGSGHLTSPFPCGLPRRAPPPREGPAAQAAAHAPLGSAPPDSGHCAHARELRLPSLGHRARAPELRLPLLSADRSPAVRLRGASGAGLLWCLLSIFGVFSTQSTMTIWTQLATSTL